MPMGVPSERRVLNPQIELSFDEPLVGGDRSVLIKLFWKL